MKVLHLASYDQWTGAAAPAFDEVLALRDAGVGVGFAFMGGGDLEERSGSLPNVHPVLTNLQDPASVWRAVRALRQVVGEGGYDVVHAHLSHDHWLARLARKRRRDFLLVRTFHSRRPLRGDPITRAMIRGTDVLCVSNGSLTTDARLAGRTVHFTPPPVDTVRFAPGSAAAPTARGAAFRAGFVGKMAPDRGFEEALAAFRALRERREGARMSIVGSGELRESIDDRARELGVSDAIDWAGYRESDLPEWYRGMDVLLQAATGSEEGHRNAIESLACGTPVAAFPLPGIEHVLPKMLIARDRDPRSLAEVALRAPSLLDTDGAVSIARRFSYRESASRLQRIYAEAIRAFSRSG